MTFIPVFEYLSQYKQIETEILSAIKGTLNSGNLILGKQVQTFERSFTEYLGGTGEAVAVNSGTDALAVSLMACGVGHGSEVITVSNTAVPTVSAIRMVGAMPVFCDVDENTALMDINQLKSCITDKTRAVIPVHLYGNVVDVERIKKVVQGYEIKIIEDCAQAHGARYKGEGVGSFGDFGAFSFYPGKNLGAYGDGGAIVSQDASFLQRCQMIANHGRLEKFDHEIEGRNSRLDGLQAAILSVKLRHLAQWIDRRNLIANRYRAGLSGIDGLVLPNQEVEVRHAYHLFVIRSPQRGSLQAYLKENGIHTGIHYPTALPKLRAYQPLGQDKEAMIANQMDQELLSLPMGDHLEDAEVDLVIEKLRNYF